MGQLASQQIETDGADGAASDDRRPGAAGVEYSAADLGQDDEADEEVEEILARPGRAQTERYLGIHAGEEEERDDVGTVRKVH